MLSSQILEPVTVLSHIAKRMKLAGLQVAHKFLTIRLRGAQWKRQGWEPKNAGNLWKLGQVKKQHLPHPTPSHGEQSGEANSYHSLP